jgi:3-hydroxyisobutyrate dehydrogenase-like beta-hydroxyacid dehydrogenase
MQAVAMIGLGHMGTPIAHSLIRAGHDVRVFNRTPSKTTLLKGYGATAADSPAAAVAGLAVVVTSLLDDDSMLNMLRREDGLLASMERDSVHVCTTTISPGCAVEMGRLHRDAGQRFVAAPVIGRPPAAEAGTLIVLAATDGDDRDLADVFDILEAISSRIIRPGGGAASAYTMKLAINFLIISGAPGIDVGRGTLGTAD